MKKLFVAIAGLLLLASPVQAQQTKAALVTEINTNWPDNTTGLITPALLRSTVIDIVNSYYDLNGASTQTCAASTWLRSFPTLSSINCTQPVPADLSGLGTGVATALGVNVGTAGAFVVNGGALGTPSSGVATNLTGTASGLTAGNVTTNANLTGPVTSVGNATTIGTNQVTRANEAQGIARSVIGVTGNATANVADIQGTANQFFGVNNAGTALAFNTMSQDCTLATGVITCLKTNNVAFTAGATAAAGQLPGEPSTGNASAGNVGEYVVGDIAVGSAISVTTTGVAQNLTSISLTAGDWDVAFTAHFVPAATTSCTQFVTSVSTTTGTLDNTFSRQDINSFAATVTGGNTTSNNVVPTRFSLSTTTTVFAVVRANFTVSTLTVYGTIRARRVR